MTSLSQPVKTSYPPAYILNETDFSTSQVTPSSPLEILPTDPVQKISLFLGVVELGRLSCVSKSLHIITTQHLWSHQLSFLDSSVASELSPKQRVKNAFFAVYYKCPEIFVKIFGIKSLVKMKIEDGDLLPESPIFSLTPHLCTIFKTEKIIRRSDFNAFMFPCIFKNHSSFVAISTHRLPNALRFSFFHTVGCVENMSIFSLTPQRELKLKDFFKSGSLQFPTWWYTKDEHVELRLPREVLTFFLET
ncbi:MAG TPA: F-box protein [Rhabdochlamydiaceae bacterium]|nr:F-box protein [Rhabdochlamydiaceae bacterium]